MADFEAIKISLLPPSEVTFKDDLLVVDRLKTDGNYVTNAVRISTVSDLITSLDLNFTGNVTFINTIQPPIGGNLDGIFDHLTIRQSLNLYENADVNGLYLNHLEDVNVDLPQGNDILQYLPNPVTGELMFINTPGIPYPPNTPSKIHGWSEDGWVDITDCLQCPTYTIGTPIILRVDDKPLYEGNTHTYSVSTPAADPILKNLTYKWEADPADGLSQAVFTNPTSQLTNVVFPAAGTYTLYCTVDDIDAVDGPKVASKSAVVQKLVTNRILREDSIPIESENGDYINFEAGTGPGATNRIGNISLKANVTNPKPNDTVTITASFDGTARNVVYSWDISPSDFDLVTQTRNSITVKFDATGDYNVSVMAQSDDAADSGTQEDIDITVSNTTQYTIGNVTINSDKRYPDIGQRVTYTAVTSGNAPDTIYAWTLKIKQILVQDHLVLRMVIR